METPAADPDQLRDEYQVLEESMQSLPDGDPRMKDLKARQAELREQLSKLAAEEETPPGGTARRRTSDSPVDPAGLPRA